MIEKKACGESGGGSAAGTPAERKRAPLGGDYSGSGPGAAAGEADWRGNGNESG